METSKILNSVQATLTDKLCAKMNCAEEEHASAVAPTEDIKTTTTIDDDVSLQKTRKRPATPTPLENHMSVSKCRHVEISEELYQLDEFCDEILFEIFQNLDTWTLLSLKYCNQRFSDLIMDYRFWQHIDLAESSLPLGLLVYVLQRANSKTHTLKLCGPTDEQEEHHIENLNKNLMRAILNKSSALTVLELENIKLDNNMIRLALLPTTLNRLTIKHCQLNDTEKSIFTSVEHYLINLKEFGCEYNDWFKPCYIMALSKLPKLTKLSLRGCNQMTEFVPYGSLASRFGFITLKYLDLRKTPITDSDLQCFSALRVIRVLLLDSPQIDHDDDDDADGDDDEKTTTCTTNVIAAPKATSHLAAYLNDAYVKEEENISFVKVDYTTEDTKINGSNSEQSQNSCAEMQQNHEAENNGKPSCSTNSATNGNNEAASTCAENESLETHVLRHMRNAGGLLEHRRDSMRFINRDLRRDQRQRPDGMPDFQYLESISGGDGPTNQIIVVSLGPSSNSMHNRFDRLMSHPIFWNMVDGNPHPYVENANNAVPAAAENPPNPRPLGRNCRLRYSVANRPTVTASQINRDFISDRGICSFGRPNNQVDRQMVWIRYAQNPMGNTLEKLLLRNYKKISDMTLKHLVQCSPNLVYLDISGTSITLEGVRSFCLQKPLCKVVANHLPGYAADAGISETNYFIF